MPIKILLQTTICAVAFSLAGGPVSADNAAPFDLSNGQWSAVGQSATTPVASATVGPLTPARQPLAAAAVAPPARALQMPVMPGIAAPFRLDVSSTAEQIPAQTAANGSLAPPPEQNWRQAATVARLSAIASAKSNGDDHIPLDIRPSFLPDAKVEPIPAVQASSRKRPTNMPAATVALKQPAPPDVAACAAVDQYKKHQLDAIQSDRQTLVALQTAIGELGLQKQLGYLTGMPDAAGSTQASAAPNGAANGKGQP